MVNTPHFLLSQPDANLIYTGTYSPVWVVVSILLAILASYAALHASAHIAHLHETASKLAWAVISAFTLGVGIWSMHFIGMLALSLPCHIYYEPLITLISMVPSILASGVALGFHGTKRLPPFVSSILLGIGIGMMHYIGMAAMRLEGIILYDPSLFTLSILVAVALSYLALRVKRDAVYSNRRRNIQVAIIMGGAVSGMHYTAMSAAYFVRGNAAALPTTVFTPNTLAVLIALTTIFLALAALSLATISRNKEMTKQLRDNEERWKFALDGAGDGLWDWRLQTDGVLFSKRWKEMLGYADHEFPNTETAWTEHIHPNDKDAVLSARQAYLSGNQSLYVIEYRMRCKDGLWKWVLARGKLVSRDEHGNPLRMIGTHSDITERKQSENELRIAATAFESQEGILVTDANNIILRVNYALTMITGYSADELIGKNPSMLGSGRQDAGFYAAMWESILHTGMWKGEIWNRRKNGEVFPELLTITAVKDQGGTVSNYVATLTDISVTKAAANEIERLAFYDPLTGLPNRRLLLDRLNLALASSHRHGRMGALLFIDMDHFKILNDTLGHDKGDLLLQLVAERLGKCVSKSDTIARLGGDEFVVMLEDLRGQSFEAAEQTKCIGWNILASIDQPYQLNGHEFRCTASIGATLFDGYHHLTDELLIQADIAMYQAKTAGRNNLCFFDPQMQESINARVIMEADLRQAMAGKQFVLFYQPQVYHNGWIIGSEMLIRWAHPSRGLVSPVDFIPLAEETGLVLPIGQWVLETACAQIKSWEANGHTQYLQLAVNVSARQFRQADFVGQVCKAIHDHAINPHRLKLELTESLVLDDIDDTIVKMNALRDIGVHFSMDDFGTGYSSLSYLTKLPLEQLKIDQSFIHNIGIKPSDSVIVQTIIGMAKNLGIKVIAEGVETPEQRAFLEQHGCPIYQGYLYSKPLPLEEFELLLKHQKEG